MAFCSNCGTSIQDDVKFCSSCGKEINKKSNGSANVKNTKKETKIEEYYDPDDVKDGIEFEQNFGWEVMSTQKIQDTNSRLERRGDDIYSVTETDESVTITYQRDKGMPNYTEIVNLEKQYHNLIYPSDRSVHAEKKLTFPIITVVVGLIALFINAGIGIGIIILGIIFIVKSHVSYKKKHAEWEMAYQEHLKEYKEYKQKQEEIIKQVQSFTK